MARLLRSVLMLLAAVSSSVIPVAAQVEEAFILRSGKVEGILAAKSVAWVEVRPDDSYARRYLAPWLGGSPARGGGFDADTLKLFKEIAVGNRVKLEWFWDGHLRVKNLKVLRPMRSVGKASGLVLEVGDKWMDVLRANGERQRYYARWVGGLVEDGGGYHGPTLDYLETLEPETLVEFAWSYDLRPRILRIRELKDEREDEEEKFDSFEGYEPIRRSPPPSAVKPELNPFDLVPSAPAPAVPPVMVPVNPFDLAPADPSSPPGGAAPGNPFDAAPPPVGPAPVNPFDGAPPAAPNPFDAAPVPAPANPFDAAPFPNNP